MTKLKIEIKESEKEEVEEERKGAYLATFSTEDDRIIFFDTWPPVNTVTVINRSYNGELIIQKDQSAYNYSNLKKIKSLKIEVELE